MNTQPEALRLADELDGLPANDFYEALGDEAAAELRRLHELALEQQGKIYALEMVRSMEQKTAKLKQDALLESLRRLLSYANVLEMRLTDADGEHGAMQQARAAIKAAEETK